MADGGAEAGVADDQITAMLSIPIRPRRVRVEFAPLPPEPKDFYDNDAAQTEIFHALSVHFPAGETFFIDTVRRHARFLKENHPKLWEQVLLFSRQEAMHTVVHEQWDARVEREFGHPIAELENLVEERLRKGVRRAPALTRLAVTSCLEHFTAGLARVLLDSSGGQHVLKCMAEPYRSLWMWHAVEELEHKSVTLDVYRAMGGGYFRRTALMLIVAPLFLIRIVQVWWSLVRRRGLPVMASVGRLLRFLFWWPGMITRFIPQLLRWFVPGYHPAHHKRDVRVVAQCLAELDSRKDPNKSSTEYVFRADNVAVPTDNVAVPPDNVVMSTDSSRL